LWWTALRLARVRSAIQTPFRSKVGGSFTFNEPDSVRRNERWIDSYASGQILMPEIGDSLTDKTAKERYLIKNLIEEAYTSSRLEGAVTTRQAAKDMIRDGRKPRNRSERMVFNNYQAMQFIQAHHSEPLSPDFVLELHRIVTEGTLDNPEMAGRLRTTDDVKVYDGDEDIVHDPPDAAELPGRIALLCDFANRNYDDPDAGQFIHPAVQAAILHFMLGYDHPFVDGNGRTARALFYWLMIRRGYWLTEFVSISRIFLQAPARYARAYLLTETDSDDLTYFIDHHLHVARRAFEALGSYLREKQKELSEFARRAAVSPYANRLNRRQLALLQRAVERPGMLITINGHRNENAVSYLTARKDLLTLTEDGLLLRLGRGPNTTFVVPEDISARLSKDGGGK
jgi:Fic family protein